MNLSASGADLRLSASQTIGSLAGVAGTTVTLGSHSLTTGDSTSTAYAGAIGGKITGAGGGGFMLLFVPPERQKQVRDALHTLLHVPFAFDGSGSRVIFYDPEPDYSQADADNRGRPLAGFREMEGLDKPAPFLTEDAPEEFP